MEHPAATRQKERTSIWPQYDAAALGFLNYWYPVTWSGSVGGRPRVFRMLGEPIMFHRENGKVYAFYDQCPHRGIPLSVGRQEFAGTWTCRYHGWTFDNETGVLKAALTDGPDSPICGKVRVRTYPVEERAGLIWVWMGEGEPMVLVESDVPEEFLHADTVLVGRISDREGNWRYAAENGFDASHAKYLHRYGILRTAFTPAPAWTHIRIESILDGEGITRPIVSSGRESEFPGLGVWPKRRFWHVKRKRQGGTDRHSIRLPGIYSSHYASGFAHVEWYVPIDAGHHRYFQFHVTRASGRQSWEFRARYWLYRRWINHVQFNNQDLWMVALMPETPPDRLFRPDVSITAWRRLCEHARGEAPPESSLEEQLREEQVAVG